MKNQIYKDISTELDLNGPYLSFTSEPVAAACTSPGDVSYSGIATVSFGASVSSPENIGTLSYQWYESGVGALSDGTNVTGTATTTLTLSNLASGTDDDRTFYITASYTPDQAEYETGKGVNQPLTSDTVGVTITPNIEIIAQPTSITVDKGTSTTFTVNADLTDGTTTGLSYQWYLDGVAETDRTKEVTVTTSTSTPAQLQYTFTSSGSHSIPATSTDIEVVLAGAQGGSGGNDGGGAGGAGAQGRSGRFSLPAGAKE